MIAFNKMDRVDDPVVLRHLAMRYPHVVFLSRTRGQGIAELEEVILTVLRSRWQDVAVILPLSAGDLVAECMPAAK